MAYYLVSAKPKTSRLTTLRGRLRQHAYDGLLPHGTEMAHSLENARLREDGFAIWEEEDDATPPLALERETVLDEFFEDLTLTPVQEGTGWERIARLPWLFPEYTQVERESPYALGFRTLEHETTVDSLPVQGAVPEWLTGRLIRTGPARFEVGSQRYRHWFDGLAMLHRFSFAAGAVGYANRFLQSRAREEALREGAIARGEFATDPCRTLFQRVASWFSPRLTDNGCVNVATWGNEVFALTETRLPVRFDPETLATTGWCEYDRQIRGPIASVHPQFDSTRGLHYSHVLDYGWRSTYRFFGIDAATGRQFGVADLAVACPAYVHSFGMTEHYLVLVECPFVVDPLRFLLRDRPFICNYEWRPERESRFHLIAKESGRVVRTALGEPFFAFHHANAFEYGDEVVIDIVTHPDPSVIDQLYLDRLRSPAPATPVGHLTRFRMGRSKRVSSQRLSDLRLELPRFHAERVTGRPYRFLYGAGNTVPGNFIDSVAKLDLAGGSSRTWHEAGCYPGEPVFVPRPDDLTEDGGVILSLVLDIRKAASFLLILDASDFRELARASVPHPIPFGIHGQFFPR